ncbi:hypothetical protein D9758_007429 [Tetrapyrgos nigripes]|uniref:Beta-lactamase-related domain-containing protein n=1 Tax=Tetrapyrgos nigripes TaxID=182062 RepID=A0A8H5G3I0_9AGAR|nr:hypothetical protein D9758_007429 [Tetrapyrgos nigripes]
MGTLNIKEHFGYLSPKLDAPEIDFNTTVWGASITKLVTTVAAMQLVEKGLVDLDEDITRVLPEWKDPKILKGFEEGTGKPVLVDSKKKMTLKHLLTHSSGMPYGVSHPWLEQYRNYMKIVPKGNSLVEFKSILSLQDHSLLPLLFEPGEGWHYGFSIDWAGAVVERLSGCPRLGDYFAKHIWGPLGLDESSWTFHPHNDDDFKKYPRMEMQLRQPDGSMEGQQANPFGIPGVYDGFGDFDGGGGGLYLKPVDYFRLLESLMRNDEVLLKKETRDMMFLPALEDNRYLVERFEIEFETTPPGGEHPYLMGVPLGTRVACGLGGVVTLEDVEGKRKKGTMWWGGMPNLVWWIDPSSQLTGFFSTQLVPTGDGIVRNVSSQFEMAVYQELDK